MTSASALGSTRIVLQFDLDRDINGAARDVQAAINAARSSLPTGLNGNPTYRKVNPADAPIMILALTSETMTQGQMYDAASTIIAQKLSQLEGVGQVQVGGSSLPAVRVEINPAGALQVRHRLRGRARGDRGRQCQSAQGRRGGSHPLLAGRRQRPGEDRRRLPSAHRLLPQRRAGRNHRRGGGRRLRPGPAQRGVVQWQAVGAR